MKPFDLEASKRGEPIVCRDGTPVKFIAHVPEAVNAERLLVLIDNHVYAYYDTGEWVTSTTDEKDIFMVDNQ